MKRLIALLVFCGFLCVGIGCTSETKSTKTGAPATGASPKAPDKKAP